MEAKKFNRFKISVLLTALLVAAVITVCLCLKFLHFDFNTVGSDYNLIQIDISTRPQNIEARLEYLYGYNTVDFGEAGENYLAHPDSVLLNKGTDNETVLTAYVGGHGKGPIILKNTTDGVDYGKRLTNTPNSWRYSEETPTLYELEFVNGSKKLILISANPKWKDYKSGDGFNASVSEDNGEHWSEFEKFYGKDSACKLSPIVAMSSLTRLKENGKFVDKWMGLFHDYNFCCYKTLLTFDDKGRMHWSKPQQFLKNSIDEKGRKIDQCFVAKKAKICEIEVVRSDNGFGDKLLMISRCESRRMNSMLAFSYDEGNTWTKLKEAPSALNGDRHKAEYLKDGRLFITFRSIERDKAKLSAVGEHSRNFFSEGWVAWVGTFDDIVSWYGGNRTAEGQYRIKLAHTYNAGQSSASLNANGDTGYAGLAVLRDGTVITSSYGRFKADSSKTFIASKRINISDTDELYERAISEI